MARNLQDQQIEELQRQLQELAQHVSNRDEELAHVRAQAEQALHQHANVPPAPTVANIGRTESILKSLQTPQIIRDLPCFDGNPVKLNSFIRAIDNIMPLLNEAEGSNVHNVWIQAVRTKIIGDADNILELYGTNLNWNEMKQNLITHYSDRRDEVSLTRDLFKIYQTNNVEEFYSKVSHTISLLINNLNIIENNAAVIASKKEFYQQMGLKVFLAGLKEPLGPIIRARGPDTMKDALRLCLEEQNYNYAKPNFKPLPPVPAKPTFAPRHQTHTHFNSSQRFPPSPGPRPQRPPYPNNYMPQRFPPRNVFPPAMAPRPFPKPIPRAVPMDVDPSTMSKHVNYMNRPLPNYNQFPPRNHFSPQANRFHVEELRNIELANHYYPYEQYQYPEEYYLETNPFYSNDVSNHLHSDNEQGNTIDNSACVTNESSESLAPNESSETPVDDVNFRITSDLIEEK